MRAFTILELIASIIILGILGSLGADFLSGSYYNYSATKEFNKLNYELDRVLNEVSSKLQNRVKNSTIVVECNATQTDSTKSDSCLRNSDKNFTSISSVQKGDSNKYPVIEWLNISFYSKRGMWSDNSIQPGWSGFVDLKDTQDLGNDEYKITTNDSNFSFINLIDGNWSYWWGVDGYDNMLENNLSVLVFSGSDGRGDLDEINNSYGYYDTNKTRIFAITSFSTYKNNKSSDTNLTIKALTESNKTTVYEGYYIVRGACAIVPVYDKKYNDYNLELRFNYFPWKGQNYMDGNSSLLATNVSYFRYKEEAGVIRVYICLTSHKIKANDDNLTVCREKVVF